MDSAETTLARSLKALADPTRLRILSIIASHTNATVADITNALPINQPTVSHHMKILLTANIVTKTHHGSWSHYHLQPGALATIGTYLQQADHAWTTTKDTP